MGMCAILLAGLLQPAAAADWYVATNGTGPGTNGWANATNNLQGAINASTPGDTVWVSNGVYNTGGVTNYPTGYSLTNRIAITKAITVRSKDNNPTNTIIKGAWDPATNGPAAARCVYMAANSVLIGFTLTNGATLTTGNWIAYDKRGGGVMCQGITTPVISNCIISGNSCCGESATYGGGGAYYGTLYNCILIGNASGYSGGGSEGSIMYNCTLASNTAVVNGAGASYGTYSNCVFTDNSAGNGGGGASSANLYNCILAGNTTRGSYGGGVGSCTLYNCIVSGNSSIAGARGGGAYNSTLYNCLLTGNSDSSGYGSAALVCDLENCTIVSNRSANAVNGGTMKNCISYYNSLGNWQVVGYGGGYITNTCTTPAQGGWAAGNITNEPMFVNTNSANYRLSARSPCINAGMNFLWMTNGSVTSRDLDGRQRVRYGIVDMGAYEHIRAGTIYDVR